MTRLLAVLAGFVSLGSEVAFTRSCELLLGNTSVTMAVVLASYLAGLAAGSALAGRSALVERRPRRAFALAQAALCAAVLAGSSLLPLLAGLPGAEAPGLASARTLCAALLLLPPALAAGFAFPPLVLLLGRGREGRGAGESTGRVYGLETLGAVLGSLAAGFVLQRLAGLDNTFRLLAAAALCGALLARWAGPVAAPGAPARGAPLPVPGAAPAAAPPRALLVALFLSGAAVLALELLWTRLLLFFVPGLTSALAAVLAGILAGTALGARAGGLLAARGAGRRAAGRLLVAAGGGAALSLALLPRLADVLSWLPRPPRGGFWPGGEMAAGFLLAVALALVSTACSGAALPLVAGALGRGARTGAARAYAWSCCGSVCGVLLAARGAGGLLPVRACVAAAGALLVLAGLLLWRPRQDTLLEPLFAGGVVAALLFVPRSAPLLPQSAEFRKEVARGRTVLDAAEDAHVIASVVDMGGNRGRALYTNAFQAASTGPGSGYMRMLGHLPVLLARSPERVLVIAYGTGTTAGSVALHRPVRSIEIAELSPAVLGLSPWFEAANHGVPHRTSLGKEIAVRCGDGRALLAASASSYDVITLEPLPPDTPAAVHFYTREFYRLCAARLADGGAVCQWIPMHSTAPPSFRVLVCTFAREFPSAWLFVFDLCVLLVGQTSADARLDAARVCARAAPREIRADLFRANRESAAAVLASFVAGRESLLAGTTGSASMCDDRPIVALGLARPNYTAWENLRENAALLLSLHEDVTGLLDLENLAEPERAELLAALQASSAAKRLLLEARVRPDEAEVLLNRALVLAPGDLEALDRLGEQPARPHQRDEGTFPGGRAEVEETLRAPGAVEAELGRAIDAAGIMPDVDATLLLPLLDHAQRTIRLRAMVALQRRLGSVAPYDPEADSAARQRVIEELRRRLGS